MPLWITAANRLAGYAASWITLGMAAMAGLTWLSGNVTFIAEQGWAAVVLSGLVLTLACILVLSLAVGAYSAWSRPASEPFALRPTAQKSFSLKTYHPEAIRLIDITMQTDGFKNVEPWLAFDCVAFTGYPTPIDLAHAEGRVRVMGQELHGDLELVDQHGTMIVDDRPIIEPYQFFQFGVRVAMGEKARSLLQQDIVIVSFAKARVVVSDIQDNVTFWIALPERISFSTARGRPQPPFSHQLTHA